MRKYAFIPRKMQENEKNAEKYKKCSKIFKKSNLPAS
jgi:hypothetical protein